MIAVHAAGRQRALKSAGARSRRVGSSLTSSRIAGSTPANTGRPKRWNWATTGGVVLVVGEIGWKPKGAIVANDFFDAVNVLRTLREPPVEVLCAPEFAEEMAAWLGGGA